MHHSNSNLLLAIRINDIIRRLITLINMKVITEMIKEMEKELFILEMAIDMKVILEMVDRKEKEFIISMMVIE